MMKGLILKNQNGYFTIYGSEGALSLCRSRGRLKRRTDILVGDYVDFETGNSGETVILMCIHGKPCSTVLLPLI